MKKVLNRAFIAKAKVLFFLFAVLALSACEGPQGPAGKNGKDGKDGEGMNWFVKDYSVDNSAHKWALAVSSDGNYYRCTFDVPELTEFVFLSGNVQGYIYLYDPNGAEYQHDLPYSLHILATDQNGNPYPYTQTIDFVFGVGWIEFQYTNSDFQYPEVPGPMNFRLALTW